MGKGLKRNREIEIGMKNAKKVSPFILSPA